MNPNVSKMVRCEVRWFQNHCKWCLKLNKLTLGCIIGVVTASEFSVAVPWFDPIITICGRPFSIGNLHIQNGICYQGKDPRIVLVTGPTQIMGILIRSVNLVRCGPMVPAKDDDEWSLWLGLSGMLLIQGRLK